MNTQKIAAAIDGALVADAYALGAHWMYDWQKLDQLQLDWLDFNDPQAHWHKTKRKGDFTHYGDHALWLLKHVQQCQQFDLKQYAMFWQGKMQCYSAYIDSSSRETLEVLRDNADASTGSSSKDISIVGRIAPLLLVCASKQSFLLSVDEFVAFTHNSSRVRAVATLFANVLFEVVHGSSIGKSLSSISVVDELKVAFDAGFASAGQNSSQTIRNFGPACGVEGAFEGVLHLLSTYDNYEQAMIANARAGGDSAARGMIVGMLMGAAGFEIPRSWQGQVNASWTIAR